MLVSIKQEVKIVMATALAPLDNDCNLHLGMLRTVYRFTIDYRFFVADQLHLH